MKYRILLAEDDVDQRKIFRLTLEMEGFQVIEAADGLEMISILQLEQFDAIMTDLSMPRIDGISAIATAKALPQHRNAIIIVVSAVSNPDVMARAYEAGATEFLAKPVSPATVIHVLQEHLSTRRRTESDRM